MLMSLAPTRFTISLHSSRRMIGAALLAPILCGACAAPAQDRAPRSSVVLMAHGGDEAWNAEVERCAADLRARHDVEIAYGMAECTTLQAAIEALESRGASRIVVARLFVRSESFRERIEYLLGMRADPPGGGPPAPDCCIPAAPHEACVPVTTNASLVLTRALDGDPLLGPILAERAASLSTAPERETVLILSHGLGDEEANDRLRADMERLAGDVRRSRPFHAVAIETLREDWPGAREEAEARLRAFMEAAARDGLRVLVVPYRLVGFGPYAEVLREWDYVSDGRGFLPHANVARWVEQQIRQTATDG